MKTRTDAAKVLIDQGWSYEEIKGVFDESDRLAGLAKLSERLAKKQEHLEKMQQESGRRKSIINVKSEAAKGYFVKFDFDNDTTIMFQAEIRGGRFGEELLRYLLFKVDPSINPPLDSFCTVEVRDGVVVKILDRRD